MRPGPGLVVMALAFISGARRGSATKESSGWSSNQDEPLPKINPWLSACDLAQPNSAPDLQGHCSGSTLSVTRVDEGPGPPGCPISCNILYQKKNKKSKIDDNNMEYRINDKPCLSYLGDADGTSPATICKKSSHDIAVQLQTLRLRHCCERNIISALNIDIFNATLNGGAACEVHLKQIEETDSLAARITCEFTEVLVRYDCGQPYSLIHHCEDCKEAYKRWVCSTIIPYFTSTSEKNNGSSNTKKVLLSRSGYSDKYLSYTIEKENDLNLSLRTKRSGKKYGERRIRVRPCLSVCQTVEQKCPYMLPGDRAPAHPTQYAGEPTFLCLDPNIPETGQQRNKSNNGLADCCYEYCNNGLCTACDPLYFTSTEDISYSNKPDNKTLVTCPIIPQITTTVSPNKQCNIPHAITLSSSSSLASKNIFQLKYFKKSKNNNILWTMVCLVQYSTCIKILIQFTGL